MFFTQFFLSFVDEYLSILLRGSQHIAPIRGEKPQIAGSSGSSDHRHYFGCGRRRRRPQPREITVISCRFFDPKIGESDEGRTPSGVTPSIFSGRAAEMNIPIWPWGKKYAMWRVEETRGTV